MLPTHSFVSKRMLHENRFQVSWEENPLNFVLKNCLKKKLVGNSLLVHWLGLHASTWGPGAILSQGTKVPQAAQRGQKRKEKKKNISRSDNAGLVFHTETISRNSAAGPLQVEWASPTTPRMALPPSAQWPSCTYSASCRQADSSAGRTCPQFIFHRAIAVLLPLHVLNIPSFHPHY